MHSHHRPLDQRKHQRILVPEGRQIVAQSKRPALKGMVTVIGLGGLFIRTRASHPRGTVLRVKLSDSLVVLEIECTVRNITEQGLGVEITLITPANQQRLKSILLQLAP
jgi:hypothetical protein